MSAGRVNPSLDVQSTSPSAGYRTQRESGDHPTITCIGYGQLQTLLIAAVKILSDALPPKLRQYFRVKGPNCSGLHSARRLDLDDPPVCGLKRHRCGLVFGKPFHDRQIFEHIKKSISRMRGPPENKERTERKH